MIEAVVTLGYAFSPATGRRGARWSSAVGALVEGLWFGQVPPTVLRGLLLGQGVVAVLAVVGLAYRDAGRRVSRRCKPS